jgi:hypothetical protein
MWKAEGDSIPISVSQHGAAGFQGNQLPARRGSFESAQLGYCFGAA